MMKEETLQGNSESAENSTPTDISVKKEESSSLDNETRQSGTVDTSNSKKHGSAGQEEKDITV